MFKVKNDKICISGYKNGKLVEEKTFHNRLTNLYLDYIIYKMIGSTLGDTLYPEFASPTDEVYIPFSQAYLIWSTIPVLDDTSTTMVEEIDDMSSGLIGGDIELVTTKTSKISTIDYYIGLEGMANETDTFKMLGFGRYEPDDYLFSFVDLIYLALYKYADTSYTFTRYDEITSNEQLVDTDEVADYLPFHAYTGDKYGELTTISLCFGLGGTDGTVDYNLSDLTLTRGTAGILDVTGFADFHIEENILYPSATLYPSESLYPTQNAEQFQSVKFTYNIYDGLTLTGTQETYVNKEDLDISYQGTSISIKLKCERGEY